MKKIIIIGGGLGGLSCAIHLAAQGHSVTILEKESELGGKLKQVHHNHYSFDLGPSTITMVGAFREVFESAGRSIEDYLEFYRIEQMTRNFFDDGHVVDITSNVEKMEAQIAEFSKEDARNYQLFLDESKRLYNIADNQFLNRLILSPKDQLNFQLIRGFSQIKPLTTMNKLLNSYFIHPNTLAMFGRYATYVGSSPYQAPAIFSMMAYLEGKLGIYGVKGGTYSIVSAFEKLANELGVTIKKNVNVERISVVNGKVFGVETVSEFERADYVVANGDALSIYKNLIEEKHRPSMTNRKIEKLEPSLSGFALLLGVKKQFQMLNHHNVFFPGDYQREFSDIFDRTLLPIDPTIYICFSGFSEPALTGGANRSNLFVLVNAPYMTGFVNWEAVKETYAQKIIALLEKKGLNGLSSTIEFMDITTPADIQNRTAAHRGAIYGLSSNSFQQSFFKVNNKSKDIDGLWFVGGSTHPGGGTPIVTRSGQLVAKAISALED